MRLCYDDSHQPRRAFTFAFFGAVVFFALVVDLAIFDFVGRAISKLELASSQFTFV